MHSVFTNKKKQNKEDPVLLFVFLFLNKGLLFLFQKRNNQQEQACTDDADDDLPNNATAGVDMQQVHDKAADEAADNANDDVPQQSEAAATHDVAGQPAYHCA